MRSVCLIPQPRATDQTDDGVRVFPEALQARPQCVPKFVDGAATVIGDFVFDHVPCLFAGIEFRAVGRQRDDAQSCGQT